MPPHGVLLGFVGREHFAWGELPPVPVLRGFLCYLNGQRFKERVFIAPYVIFCTVSLKQEVSPVVSSHHILRQSVLG